MSSMMPLIQEQHLILKTIIIVFASPVLSNSILLISLVGLLNLPTHCRDQTLATTEKCSPQLVFATHLYYYIGTSLD